MHTRKWFPTAATAATERLAPNVFDKQPLPLTLLDERWKKDLSCSVK